MTELKISTSYGQDDTGAYMDLHVNEVTQRFRWIPAGSFTMGSPPEEPGRWDDETQREVDIDEGFWMADTACAQDLWQLIMESNPSCFKNPRNPVETVSYIDVMQFVKKLNEVTGMEFNLPTEAEWEYACRAGTTTAFNWGGEADPSKANFFNSRSDGKRGPVPVASYDPNDWGLYDMHGNVSEWCRPE